MGCTSSSQASGSNVTSKHFQSAVIALADDKTAEAVLPFLQTILTAFEDPRRSFAMKHSFAGDAGALCSVVKLTGCASSALQSASTQCLDAVLFSTSSSGKPNKAMQLQLINKNIPSALFSLASIPPNDTVKLSIARIMSYVLTNPPANCNGIELVSFLEYVRTTLAYRGPEELTRHALTFFTRENCRVDTLFKADMTDQKTMQFLRTWGNRTAWLSLLLAVAEDEQYSAGLRDQARGLWEDIHAVVERAERMAAGNSLQRSYSLDDAMVKLRF